MQASLATVIFSLLAGLFFVGLYALIRRAGQRWWLWSGGLAAAALAAFLLVAMDKPALGVLTPFDGNPASVGYGVMVAIVVDSREKVERVHRKALELGGQDEGALGPRGDGFYAGYFRDLDGNKPNVFCFG